MGIMSGKKGIVMGVANSRSIATAVAHALHKEGAELGFSFLPDDKGKGEFRTRKALEGLEPLWLQPCDVDKDDHVEEFFKKAHDQFGPLDFIVHSIAFAPVDEIRRPTLEVSRGGFLSAMETSVYSLISVAQKASPYLKDGASIVTMSYFGGEKVVVGYNLMGVAKAALECSVRYLSHDLGKRGIRVNAVSAGPLKTLAASAIGDFNAMLDYCAQASPLQRNVSLEEVAQSSVFLLSGMSSGISGEVMHVDCGFNVMGTPIVMKP